MCIRYMNENYNGNKLYKFTCEYDNNSIFTVLITSG